MSGTFDSDLAYIAEELEEALPREFSTAVAKSSVALRLSVKALLEEPSPDSMARVLCQFSQLVEAMLRELEARPEVRAWRLAAQCATIAERLSGPSPVENPAFRQLPQMLMRTPWVRDEIESKAATAGISALSEPIAKGFRKTVCAQWLRTASRPESAQLYELLDDVPNDLEFRVRQVWLMRKAVHEEPSFAQVYAWSHGDLYPTLRSPFPPERLGQEVARLCEICSALKVEELAQQLEGVEWLAQYALNFLMPPSPEEWAIRRRDDVSRLLTGRLSRWHFRPFMQRLEPLDMVGAIISAGRPLLYERPAAHALLEHSLLQSAAFSTQTASVSLDILKSVEHEFEVLFDGFLLRLMHQQRLGSPQGWCDYLGGMHTLHYQAAQPPGLEAFRKEYLDQRGIRSLSEILLRSSTEGLALN